MRILLLYLLCSPLFAQDLINQIIEGNPFDPSRGHKDLVVAVDSSPTIPTDLPLCDGTLILGELRFALLTFRVEGEPAFKYMKIGEEANGYKVTEVNYNSVVLDQNGRIHTIKLFEQETKKDKRGGSRKMGIKKKPSVKKPGLSRKKKDKPKLMKNKKTNKKTNQPRLIKKTSKRPKIDF